MNVYYALYLFLRMFAGKVKFVTSTEACSVRVMKKLTLKKHCLASTERNGPCRLFISITKVDTYAKHLTRAFSVARNTTDGRC